MSDLRTTVLHAAARCCAGLLLTASLAGCASSAWVDPGIVRATFVYVDDAAAFRTTLDEAGLGRAGCMYVTQDRAALQAMHRLLAGSRIDPAPGRSMIEPRYALYLDKPDGTVSTLLFDRLYDGLSLRDGARDGKPVTVPGSLAPQLRQWAARFSIPQSNPACK